MQKFLRALLSLLILAAAVIGIRLITQRDLHQVTSPSKMVMGTLANVIAVAENKSTAEKAIKAAFDQLRYVDETMSDYIEKSELSNVNKNAFEKPVKVSDELYEVLTASVKYSKISDGAFDVTIGPVVDLWRQAEVDKKKPTEQQIDAAKEKVGYDKLILDPEKRTVRFAVEGMKLDLGAIAKGYAIDLAIQAMRSAGATGGMVDAGGDIRTFGKPAEKAKWKIAIQSPEEGNGFLEVLQLNETAIATSGDYRRFVVLDGERYSHIITPHKGTSARDFSSVSIIAPTAMDADALATTVSVIGREKGLQLIESLPQTEAMLIQPDMEKGIVYTSGFKKYIDMSISEGN